jgi:hypothetical protein
MTAVRAKSRRVWPALAGWLMIAGCGAQPDAAPVRVTGEVVRGPTTPVCQIDVSCEAPFSAGFSVLQDGRTVVRFRSDTNGRFTIDLSAGNYTVIPDADAPILSPRLQQRSLTVPDTPTYTVQLSFDTGIR